MHLSSFFLCWRSLDSFQNFPEFCNHSDDFQRQITNFTALFKNRTTFSISRILTKSWSNLQCVLIVYRIYLEFCGLKIFFTRFFSLDSLVIKFQRQIILDIMWKWFLLNSAWFEISKSSFSVPIIVFMCSFDFLSMMGADLKISNKNHLQVVKWFGTLSDICLICLSSSYPCLFLFYPFICPSFSSKLPHSSDFFDINFHLPVHFRPDFISAFL